MAGNVVTDMVSENTPEAGVSIENVLMKDRHIVLCEFDGTEEPPQPNLNKLAVFAKDGCLWIKDDQGEVTNFCDAIGAVDNVVCSDTAPANITGAVLWNRTTPGCEGLYFRDKTRDKWLSTNEETFTLGHDNANNNFLRPSGIASAGDRTAYLMRKNGTIVGVAARGRDGNDSKTFEIRIDGINVNSFSLTAFKEIDNTLDIDFDALEDLTVFATEAGAKTQDVTVVVSIRWRE